MPTLRRGVVEVSGIMFLFYSNLLMGEFSRSSNNAGKPLWWAINDVITRKNFAIGLALAVLGFSVFEALRKRI